ncbi:uncharacterized protein LOC143462406 isoform X2 [Clavelina lepadiformis]|uniref:uncharacterized protein LOC143462406 isoform X2 n=1 Tax=Clavelina lepadiformis TaxID=159417 RepID=UPI00404333D1
MCNSIMSKNNPKRRAKCYGSHKTSILADLNNDRFDRDSYCDVTLIVENKLFAAHRCILGKLSNFFHRMFKSEMREKYDSVVHVELITADIMHEILAFVYTASIELNENNAMDILAAADYLQMDELKNLCANFLSGSMNSGNCLTSGLCGQIYNCKSLLECADTIGAQHFEEIVKEDEFKELDFKTVLSFLQTRDQKAFGAKTVYEASIDWVKYDTENRKEHFPDFLKIVKLHLLQPSYLEEVVAEEVLVKSSNECKEYFQSELLRSLKMPNKIQEKVPESVSESKAVKVNGLSTVSPLTKKILPKRTSAQNPSTNGGRQSSAGRFHRTVVSYPDDVEFSKELVRILRHGRNKQINIDSSGYANVPDILQNSNFMKTCGMRTLDDVKQLVDNDERNRFDLKCINLVWKIKATYGHSVQVQKGQSSQNRHDYSHIPYPGNVEVSKELVRILRHGKYKELQMDSERFIFVQDILDCPRFLNHCGELTMEDIEDIVESSDKQRFLMKCVGSRWKIKATRGHSVPVS